MRDLGHYQWYNSLQIKKVPRKESVYEQKNISLKVDKYIFVFILFKVLPHLSQTLPPCKHRIDRIPIVTRGICSRDFILVDIYFEKYLKSSI